ncbi:MAG: hypothetical protein ABGZ53_12640 [Fuerstiella sp.]
MLRMLPSALATLCILGFASCSESTARDWTAEKDGSPVVAVQVDLSAFADSQVGKLLIKAGTALAAEELEKDPDEAIKAVIKSLGFDPFEQEAKLTVTVFDLEDPIEGLRLNIQLKDTTGNLEGFLLAAPGYRTTKHGTHTVHAVDLDGNKLFIAFADESSGKKRIIASGNQADVTASLDAMSQPSSQDSAGWKMPAGQFISVQLLSPPKELIEEVPFANIAHLLTESSLSLGEVDDDLVVRLTIGATEEAKAIQLQQLAQGAIAMVSLFEDEIRGEFDDEETVAAVLAVLDDISIERDGMTVSVETRIPQDLIIRFLREEAGLSL